MPFCVVERHAKMRLGNFVTTVFVAKQASVLYQLSPVLLWGVAGI